MISLRRINSAFSASVYALVSNSHSYRIFIVAQSRVDISIYVAHDHLNVLLSSIVTYIFQVSQVTGRLAKSATSITSST